MNSVWGFDTSNYTTSVSCYQNRGIIQRKRLLPVPQGQMGLRQSDAVFHHVQQLPVLVQDLAQIAGESPCAVGVSVRPRDVEGSYMPCFTVGKGAAYTLGAVMRIPVFSFSHQAGHLAAALYSAGRLDLMERAFLAFHVSGGTTEALLVQPDKENIFHAELVGRTLDLTAGQAVDRVGGMLGLPFPAGPRLEELAQHFEGEVSCRPVIKGKDCCLSGLQNLCEKRLQDGVPPEEIARFCIEYLSATLEKMCEKLLAQYGDLPVLFAGGVMCNTIIRRRFTKRFGAVFAAPEYSSDNAAGIAVLAALKAGVL